MNKTLGFAIATAWLLGPSLAVAKDDSLETFGDIMQFALPAAGLAGTYLADDPEGRKQWGYSLVTALGTTTVLKYGFEKLRPNSESRTSFPSGHTTAAFQGAGFIDGRYGHKWGIPAYILAAVTGYSRVDSDNHFMDDVLAGASIGLFSNWFWVTPYSGDVVVLPALSDDAVGVRFRLARHSKDDKGSSEPAGRPVARYSLDIGSAWLQKNSVTSPSSSGTTFRLDEFDNIDDPTTSAIGTLEWFVGDRSTLIFSFAPFESRDTGSFDAPVRFGDQDFPAATDLKSAWLLYDLSAAYAYTLLPGERLNLRAGVGLSYQYTDIELQTLDDSMLQAEDEPIKENVTDSVVLPFLYGSLDYAITDRWHVVGKIGGTAISSDKYLFGDISIRFRIDQRWDFGLGAGYYERGIDEKTLKNEVEYHSALLSVGYSFI